MEAWLSRLPKGELLSRCNLGEVGLGEFAVDVILSHLSCDANGCDVIRSGEESGKYVRVGLGGSC